MIQKLLNQITKDDIESLVNTKEGERRTLEYKLQLPGFKDEDKKEFCYDVSSFANAAGGDLIFGIEDERDENKKPTGRAGHAYGVEMSNASEAMGRLNSLMRDGIKPRISSIDWWPVDGFEKGPVLILRVGKSLAAPHMVTIAGASRFYSRNSTGKYFLDVDEIRSAFAASTGIGERLRSFRANRLANIISDETPIRLGNNPKVLIDLVPISALEPGGVDVTRSAYKLMGHLVPMGPISNWGNRYNFDGVLVYSEHGRSYVQMFRSGIIEAVAGQLLDQKYEQYKGLIPSSSFESTIVEAVSRYLSAQKALEISLPLFIMITLVGVKGFTMSHGYPMFTNPKIEREVLPLPEVLIEDYSVDAGRVLRPAFDALWQACGLEQCVNYDAAGNWKAKA
jgi:hypothetical protein